MKNLHITIKVIILLSIFGISVSSCKKQKQGCAETGGITQYPRYIFYIKKDFGCGFITVIIEDSKGNKIDLNQYEDKIKVIDYILPESNCYGINTHVDKRAHATLTPGQMYKYTASCQSKTWSGTINVPCDFQLCNYIELQ